jgi:hypothetical protein
MVDAWAVGAWLVEAVIGSPWQRWGTNSPPRESRGDAPGNHTRGLLLLARVRVPIPVA